MNIQMKLLEYKLEELYYKWAKMADFYYSKKWKYLWDHSILFYVAFSVSS